MSATANKFGSLSADTYLKPATVTGSNPANFTETAKPAPPANTEINRHELTQVYDPHTAADVNEAQKSGFSHTAATPVAPAYWNRGNDYSKNGGVASVFDNVNNPTPALPATAGGPAVITGS